jgi:glutamine synthetase
VRDRRRNAVGQANVRQVSFEETPDFGRRVEEAKARLGDAGVKYVFGSWVDVHGRSKAKAVPFGSFDRMVRGSELYTVGALEGMGPLGPHEDECAALPDLDSLTVCPWDRRLAWMASDLWWHGEHYPYDSRWILKQVLDQAAHMGFTLNLGFEPEVYILREDPDGTLHPFHPNDRAECWGYDVESTLDAMPFLDVMVEYLDELGWGIFSFDHEGGNSQYEFDFGYADALTTADRFVFMRLMLKEVAKRYGAFATFMPKPLSDNFGSAAHYNMSLADESGRNLFEDREDSRGLGYSELAYHFAGGLLKHAGAITAVTCPTVNSYKRLIGQGYMPMITWAPVYVLYGDNNRSCMLRFPGNRTCIENRAADIAGNIYLGAAVALAAGLEGIKEGIDPGDPTPDNLYELSRDQLAERGIETLPRTLLHALSALEVDPLADQVLGPLKKPYLELKYQEWEQYHNVVSDWEVKKYLHFF